ncbi:Golgi-associated kinase 1A-like [Salarias fasciatus]|uniref:Golgi-associated kinase 1A-like n=1 Tax=Salarias fasciatus TaxID=181472 RepID=UPI0011768A42|nr:Golgi-associated kinase 1A-like [Salarias fasciatus]
MVRRVWSALCCSQKWILVFSPLLLLSLTVLMMAVTPPLPLPASSRDRRSSRALSSAEDFVRPGPRMVEPPRAAMDPFLHPPLHSGAWRGGVGGEKRHYPPQPKPSGDDRTGFRGRSRSSRYKRNGSAVASRRNQPLRSRGRRQPRFTAPSSEPRRRISRSDRSAGAKPAAPTYVHAERSRSTAAPARPDAGGGPKNSQIQASTKTGGLQQASGTLRREKRHAVRADRAAEAATSPTVGLKESPSTLKDDRSWCQTVGEQDFPDGDRRSIRTGGGRLPWLSRDDVQKMELLARGEVVSKASVPAHGQVLQVGLDPPADPQSPPGAAASPGRGAAGSQPSGHGQRCRTGRCCLVKRTEDWFEVFAFHLDRVLGLNRSLPAVLRAFRGDVLPYRYTGGAPRPALWWDPDIRHLADRDNDQNSVPLSWVQYQRLLQAHCGGETALDSAPCVGVRHSEWGRLALFDFLLQVSDRLDRYCCGFTPDPAELCVENLLHAKCGSSKDLLLVHILVRTADPSRLVFIDNAGRPQQSADNLNFRLIEGIDEFPETAASVLRSGCLERLLLRSLYTDREFWESRGGAAGLRPLVRTVQQRGDVLLRHIQDRKLRLRSDL